MARVHASAVVDPGAELDDDVEVGPFAVIGAGVRIAAGTRILAHATVEGPTTLGRGNVVHPHATIGGPPQDKKYRGEPTTLEIGDGNTFRECVTVNRGTIQDTGVTRIGDDNWVMAYVHIAHDCRIGSHTILANTTNLGGHVELGDYVILGGCTQVHQFCKVGAHAMTGTGTILLHDVPPYVLATGNPSAPHGLNTEGLKRRGFEAETIALLKRAYRTLYRSELSLQHARERLEAELLELTAHEAASQAALPATALTAAESLRLLTGFLARVERGIVR
ncbi:MAG: acyl-ACP--UDP-N-acetylglucosamine O-acyltransferase [Burkholderiales bacterium]|nr:MAG: acyl-ACP--UDP-N-acetylglucosamine O-acyltransferase [Burkholderiales bacterium]